MCIRYRLRETRSYQNNLKVAITVLENNTVEQLRGYRIQNVAFVRCQILTGTALSSMACVEN